MQEFKEHIKTRMLKNASKVWGYPVTESENNFDPLVAMLMASCSTELGKISDEIHASRSRILERMVQILSPDVLTGALPAHGIINAYPADMHVTLEADSQFFVNRNTTAFADTVKNVSKNIFFSPTAAFKLNRASIRFMATGNELHSIGENLNKEIVSYSRAGKELPPSTLWLAIDEPDVCLDKTMFYFELRNEANKNLFFHQLPKASWSVNNKLLKHSTGYNENDVSGERLNINGILKGESNVYDTIQRHVNAYYKNAFITLFDEDTHSTSKEFLAALPTDVSETFQVKDIQLLEKAPLRWVVIRFPETISSQLLKDVSCNMNCFPVMNSRIHQLSYRLNEMINIVPLQTEDLFLDLAEVSDDEGNIINIRSQCSQKEDPLTMLMRHGGIGRFDERDAASIIDYILQLLKDDSAAFTILGNDFISNEMKTLQQTINKLEQQLSTRQINKDPIPYLVMRFGQMKSRQHLFIRYWSTNGSEANNIKAGTKLLVYKGGALNNNVHLLTTTHGGRNKLSATESVLAYKSALLSKDRLISVEDIKAFCQYQLGERATNITVQKGVMIHPDEKKGFVKTLDVTISIDKQNFAEMEGNGELDFWINKLTLLLEEKSISLLPYRIVLQ